MIAGVFDPHCLAGPKKRPGNECEGALKPGRDEYLLGRAGDTAGDAQVGGDRFAEAVLNDTPVPTPLTDAVANMRIIEALVESARGNAWVALS